MEKLWEHFFLDVLFGLMPFIQTSTNSTYLCVSGPKLPDAIYAHRSRMDAEYGVRSGGNCVNTV